MGRRGWFSRRPPSSCTRSWLSATFEAIGERRPIIVVYSLAIFREHGLENAALIGTKKKQGGRHEQRVHTWPELAALKSWGQSSVYSAVEVVLSLFQQTNDTFDEITYNTVYSSKICEKINTYGLSWVNRFRVKHTDTHAGSTSNSAAVDARTA